MILIQLFKKIGNLRIGMEGDVNLFLNCSKIILVWGMKVSPATLIKMLDI